MLSRLFLVSLSLLFCLRLTADPKKTKARSAKSQKASAAEAAEAKAIVDRFQQTWDKTTSYQANFKQIITSTAVGTTDESAGSIFVVKPGKLRWEIKSEGNIQILNGKRLTLIQENRRRKNRVVDVYPDVSRAVDSKSLNFLSGKSRFSEIYDVKVISNSKDKAEIKLVPKGDSKESFIAEIDKNSYLLRALTTESVDSKVRLDFSDIKTGVSLGDELFEYKPGPDDIVNEAKS